MEQRSSMERTWHSLRQLFVSLLMVLTIAAGLAVACDGMKAWAVTGSEVAANGEYTSTLTAYKYKDGERTSTYYTAKLYVTVKDGKISEMAVSDGMKYKDGESKSSTKIAEYLLPSISTTYIGKEASVSAIEGVDAVSGATTADVDTTSSATKTEDHDKYYIADVKGAVIAALKTAPAAQSSSDPDNPGTVRTVTGTASVDDSEGSKIVVKVGLDKDGKITSITADPSSVGSWDSIVSKNKSSYIGQTGVDAVSGATKYSAALNEAVRNALNSGSSSGGGGDNPGGGSDDTITYKSGQTYTVTGQTFTNKKIIVENGADVTFSGVTFIDCTYNFSADGLVKFAGTFKEQATGTGNVANYGVTLSGNGYPANVGDEFTTGTLPISQFVTTYSVSNIQASVSSTASWASGSVSGTNVTISGTPTKAGTFPLATITFTANGKGFVVPLYVVVTNQHTLTYNDNVESENINVPDDQTTDDDGKTTVSSTTPTREGYSFLGWSTDKEATTADNNYAAGKEVTLSADTTLYAVWKVDTHTVTFDMKGHGTGTAPDAQTVDHNGKAVRPATDPTEAGYTFDGWYADADCTTVYDFDTPVTADTTVYAKWTPTQYAITYDLGGGNLADGVTNPGSYTVESDDITLKNPTKEGYTFAGWTGTGLDAAAQAVTIAKGSTGDRSYTATWTAAEATYTVTFNSDGGSAVDAQTVDSGQTATKPADPTKDGYTFKGWKLGDADYEFSTPVTSDITLTAQWEQTQTPVDPDNPDNPDTPTPNPGYTIDTTQKSHTYEIYQIFTGDYTEKDGKAILSNLVWGENGKGTDANPAAVGQPVPEDIINALKALTGGEVEPSDKTKLAEIEKYVNMTSTTNYPKTVKSENGDKAEVTGLPAGYYLIKDKDNSQTGQDDSYTLYITQIVKDYTIQPKSVKPTVDKQVATDGSNWGETADYAIGKSFQFKLTATLPASGHYADYDAYKLVFTDTMSDGVTFESIASVTVGSTAVPEGSYTVSGVKNGDAGKTWTLTLNNVKSVQSDLSGGATVTVVYNAHLNENAIAYKASADSVEANKNTVSLQYSNNPNTDHGTDMGQTASDTVYTFTFEVDNTKRKNSEDGDPLPDAGFRLYYSNGTTEIPLTYNAGKKAYIPAAAGTTGEEMKSAADGTFNIVGLDAGTYTLKETTTPAGYNKCPDKSITITASHEENADASTAKLTLSGDTNNTVINNSGTALPSTGGIGTVIFYVLGTILVIGAGVVLISRKRNREE